MEKPPRHKVIVEKKIIDPEAVKPAGQKQLEGELQLVGEKLRAMGMNEGEIAKNKEFYSIMRTNKEILQAPENAWKRIMDINYKTEKPFYHLLVNRKSIVELYDLSPDAMAAFTHIMLEVENRAKTFHRKMWEFDSIYGSKIWDEHSGKNPPSYNPPSRYLWLAASLREAEKPAHDELGRVMPNAEYMEYASDLRTLHRIASETFLKYMGEQEAQKLLGKIGRTGVEGVLY